MSGSEASTWTSENKGIEDDTGFSAIDGLLVISIYCEERLLGQFGIMKDAVGEAVEAIAPVIEAGAAHFDMSEAEFCLVSLIKGFEPHNLGEPIWAMLPGFALWLMHLHESYAGMMLEVPDHIEMYLDLRVEDVVNLSLKAAWKTRPPGMALH